jgi:sec-independent protein translocase protein TatA
MPMGGTELLILLAIILLFFGATRVPQLGRSLGQSMREFRKGASEDSDNELEGETKERREIPPQKEEDPATTKEARSSHS